MFRFLNPIFLLLLLCLPLGYLYERKKKRARVVYSDLGLVKQASSRPLKNFLHAPWLLRSLILALLIFAISRPQLTRSFSEISSEVVDIVLTLDASLSMKLDDFVLDGRRVTRLDAVKSVVRDFIKKRPQDRMGMVVFGSFAYTQAPLTLDKNFLLTFLDKLYPAIAGNATAIGDGLALSVKRLKDLDSKSKIIVLLTDGKNQGDTISPEKAAEFAKTSGIKVYTIGVGSREGGYLPGLHLKLETDEETLKKIALETGGKYFWASDTEKLAEIYQIIDKMEKREVKTKSFEENKDLFRYAAIPALILFIFDSALGLTLWRRIP